MKSTRSRAAMITAAVGSCVAFAGCDSSSTLRPCDPPALVSNTIKSPQENVLSGLMIAHVRLADSVALRFGIAGERLDSSAPAVKVTGDSAAVPLLGLRELTQYNVAAVAFNNCGTTAGPTLTFATNALPSDLPRYSASGSDPSPGYIAFAAGTYGIVIDNTGRVVWYHRFPNGPGLNFQPQPNGRYVARPLTTTVAAEFGKWVEIDPLGNVTRTLGCAGGFPARLHDFLAEANGSYWVMCDRTRTVDLSSSGGSSQALVMGTGVQHIGNNGEILFDWSPFDHIEVDLRAIDFFDQSVVPINWTHGNALDLDADGNLIVSFRNPSEIIKIDVKNGAVLWRMGGSRNQFTFENVAAPVFARQHGVRATAAGRLHLLDNLGDSQGSRAERYEYDEKLRTVRLISSIASSSGAIALTGGTTQDLPGGRALISFGSGASVEESDASGKVVWKLTGNPGYVFRAQRIRSLYTPGVGDPR